MKSISLISLITLIFGTVIGLGNSVLTEVLSDENELCLGESWPPELYDNETKKCYQAGTQGPCGTYMLFYQESENSKFGKCGCISARDVCSGGKLNRPIARSKDDGQCYPLFSEANCGKGNLFTVDAKWEGICTNNPCLNLTLPKTDLKSWENIYGRKAEDKKDVLVGNPIGISFWELNKPFWYLENGTCYMTHSRGPCPQRARTYFEGTQPNPRCYQIDMPHPCPFSTTSSMQLNCPPGMSKLGDDCKPSTGSVVFQ